MRRTLMFDQLETRKLLTTNPVWDSVTGWATSPTPIDINALDGAYTRPLATPPAPTIVYPDHPPFSDLLPTRIEIITAP